MKKLIRLLVLAAAVAGVVWLLKDRLVPAPGPLDDPPPPVRQPPRPHLSAEPPAAPAPAQPDDLTVIMGIGPKYAELLSEMGIATYASLAGADAAQLATDLPGASEARVASWIEQAASLS